MDTSEILSKMVNNEPYKVYQKTTLGKVFVNFLDPLTNEQKGMILEGDPKKGEGTFETWGQLDDLYFRRANNILFSKGYLVEYNRPIEKKKSPNEKTDEEIEELVNARYLAFQNEVQKIDSEVTLKRILAKAVELGKSDKIITFLEQRIAEVQQQEFAVEEQNAD
jgi:hypothetical protein